MGCFWSLFGGSDRGDFVGFWPFLVIFEGSDWIKREKGQKKGQKGSFLVKNQDFGQKGSKSMIFWGSKIAHPGGRKRERFLGFLCILLS